MQNIPITDKPNVIEIDVNQVFILYSNVTEAGSSLQTNNLKEINFSRKTTLLNVLIELMSKYPNLNPKNLPPEEIARLWNDTEPIGEEGAL